MKNVYIIPGTIELALVNEELEKVHKEYDELQRLQSIGYGYSQMALDAAINASSHLKKAYVLLLKTKVPGWEYTGLKILDTMVNANLIIRDIILKRKAEGL